MRFEFFHSKLTDHYLSATKFFPLIKSISFSYYLGEKTISIDKIHAFPQALKVVIPVSHDRT